MTIADLREMLAVVSETLYFDSKDFLREKSSNPSLLKEGILLAEGITNSDIELAKEDRYFLLGSLGNLYRIAGLLDKAISCLTQALDLARQDENITKEIIAEIRLGEALKYADRQKEALEKFETALTKCRKSNLDLYIDFALQHKGKCLMELNRLKEAVACFEATLKIRKRKGIASLIDSTEKALHLAMKMQN